MAVSLSLPPDCGGGGGVDLNSLSFCSGSFTSPESNISTASSSGTLRRFSRGFPSCLRGAPSPDECENSDVFNEGKCTVPHPPLPFEVEGERRGRVEMYEEMFVFFCFVFFLVSYQWYVTFKVAIVRIHGDVLCLRFLFLFLFFFTFYCWLGGQKNKQ